MRPQYKSQAEFILRVLEFALRGQTRRSESLTVTLSRFSLGTGPHKIHTPHISLLGDYMVGFGSASQKKGGIETDTTIIIYKCNKYPEVNFMYALAFKDKILIKGSYREVLDHCFILRKEQGYLLSDSRYKLLNLETGEPVCQ